MSVALSYRLVTDTGLRFGNVRVSESPGDILCHNAGLVK